MEVFWEEFIRGSGLEQVSTLVAVMSGAIGMFLSILAKQSSDSEDLKKTTAFEATNDIKADSRLNDLTNEFERNRTVARWSSSAATLLTFSQFIVGGVLASSFIQEALSPSIVGLLGVLVLLSSLIHQRYRPDLHALQAKQRMFISRKLIRHVEDDLFSIQNEMENAPTIFEIRQKASRGLSELEEIEIEGTASIVAQTSAPATLTDDNA